MLNALGGGGRRDAANLARVLRSVAHRHVLRELAAHGDTTLTDRLLAPPTAAVLEVWRSGQDG